MSSSFIHTPLDITVRMKHWVRSHPFIDFTAPFIIFVSSNLAYISIFRRFLLCSYFSFLTTLSPKIYAQIWSTMFISLDAVHSAKFRHWWSECFFFKFLYYLYLCRFSLVNVCYLVSVVYFFLNKSVSRTLYGRILCNFRPYAGCCDSPWRRSWVTTDPRIPHAALPCTYRLFCTVLHGLVPILHAWSRPPEEWPSSHVSAGASVQLLVLLGVYLRR